MRSSTGSGAICSLNPDRVGRDGHLSLRFGRSGGRTALLRSRFSLPLQALAPLLLEDGSIAMALLNPTGGMLGGDRLETEVVLEEAAHVCLTTPSATRVYRSDGEPSMQRTVIRVGQGATLEYFPEHLIPHAGAALHQSLRVEIEAGGRVLLWDAMASGRVARGERWCFREIVSDIEVFVCGRPAWLSRTAIDPAVFDPRQPGAMESYAYSGSLAIFSGDFIRWPQLSKAIDDELAAFPQAHCGVGTMPAGGCLARMLTDSAVELTAMCAASWRTARALVLNLPAFETRKY